jgi:hypothetical protein
VGVDQGGCASDCVYLLVNNEQLETAQKSELGIDMGLAVGRFLVVLASQMMWACLEKENNWLPNEIEFKMKSILLNLTKVST